jgi:hypothetical protein
MGTKSPSRSRRKRGGVLRFDIASLYPRLHRLRRSVTLPPEVARQADTIAKRRRLGDNRVLVELIEQGIEVRRQKERAFFELAERFRAASDPEQVRRLGDDLGRFVFGE